MKEARRMFKYLLSPKFSLSLGLEVRVNIIVTIISILLQVRRASYRTISAGGVLPDRHVECGYLFFNSHIHWGERFLISWLEAEESVEKEKEIWKKGVIYAEMALSCTLRTEKCNGVLLLLGITIVYPN